MSPIRLSFRLDLGPLLLASLLAWFLLRYKVAISRMKRPPDLVSKEQVTHTMIRLVPVLPHERSPR